VISNEVDTDGEGKGEGDDDEAATQVIATKEVLEALEVVELSEIVESDFSPPRVRPTPPPIPNRAPTQPPEPPDAATQVQPAWGDEGDNDETLTYDRSIVEEDEVDDEAPTRSPPDVAAKQQAPEATDGASPPTLDVVAPVAASASIIPPLRPAPFPGERASLNPRATTSRGPPPGPDLATKLLLGLIVVLASALAVVLVLIARR
jgi:hypothetical protein